VKFEVPSGLLMYQVDYFLDGYNTDSLRVLSRAIRQIPYIVWWHSFPNFSTQLFND